MKDNNHSPTESTEKKHYKKSYLVRLLEEKEASQEIERCIYYEHEETLGLNDDNSEAINRSSTL